MEDYRVARIANLFDNDVNTLVKESKKEGFRFVERLVKEYQNGANNFTKQGEALYGVYNEKNGLVSVGGLNLDPFSDEEKVGRLRRFYVKQEFRRVGIGTLLLRQIVNDASHKFSVLVLNTDTEEADKFYTSFGFAKGNLYPNSTHYLLLSE